MQLRTIAPHFSALYTENIVTSASKEQITENQPLTIATLKKDYAALSKTDRILIQVAESGYSDSGKETFTSTDTTHVRVTLTHTGIEQKNLAKKKLTETEKTNREITYRIEKSKLHTIETFNKLASIAAKMQAKAFTTNDPLATAFTAKG